MPTRRRRATWSVAKSNSKRQSKVQGGDPDAPTAAQWETMTVYQTFVVIDEDGNEVKFCKGDTATILPHGIEDGSSLELHEYWIVRIRDIRGITFGDNSNEVWAKVQWYYSPANVAEVVKSFEPNLCGQNEFIFSDHFDVVSSQTFNEVIKVSKLKDEDPEQEYIPEDELYCRYTFEVKARKVQPKPGSQTCICDQPYEPDNKSSSSLMHFCPRPACRTWYHQSCLTKAKSKELASSDRDMQLLSSSPDSDDTIALEELIALPKKRRRSRPSKKDIVPDEASGSVQEMLDSLPAELVHVAQQQIVRGAAFTSGSVAGNVAAVVRARRLVYEAFGGSAIADDWESTLTGGDEDRHASDAIVIIKGRRFLPALLCPKCKGAI